MAGACQEYSFIFASCERLTFVFLFPFMVLITKPSIHFLWIIELLLQMIVVEITNYVTILAITAAIGQTYRE